MERRRWLALALVALAAAAVVLVLTWPTPVEERARRVHKGMTRAEVIVAVGEPPGHYARPYARGAVWADDGFGFGVWHEGWYWDDGVLRVWFDKDGRVSDTSFHTNPDPKSALDLWRDRLGV
jgi:hypothetical protein